jgi:hypothetical protein
MIGRMSRENRNFRHEVDLRLPWTKTRSSSDSVAPIAEIVLRDGKISTPMWVSSRQAEDSAAGSNSKRRMTDALWKGAARHAPTPR